MNLLGDTDVRLRKKWFESLGSEVVLSNMSAVIAHSIAHDRFRYAYGFNGERGESWTLTACGMCQTAGKMVLCCHSTSGLTEYSD